MLLRRREADAERKGFTVKVDDRIREVMRAVLPFHLTAGQRQALKDIGEDMQRAQPMNRLLQGDVGSGKTIVALLASVLAMENGLQVAFMAPTEILAEQHFQTIERLLAPDAVQGGAAHRHACRGVAQGACAASSPPGTSTWSSARTRSCRTTSRSSRWVWPWWTSSTASACCSARRCAPRACGPTCS